MSNLSSEDATVAVIIERLTRMQSDAERDRAEARAERERERVEMRAEFKAIREEMALNKKEAQKQISDLTDFVKSVRGGWWLLGTLGALATTVLTGMVAMLTFGEKLSKFLQ